MLSLEPLFQNLRIKKVLPYINPGKIIIDIGCDHPPKLLTQIAPKMEYCIGIDDVIKYSKNGNIETFNQNLKKEIKIKSESADYITMLAVLEHLKYPKDILKETYRILKKDGELLITVPSPKSKGILELLSKLNLVRPEMIDQHENYFTKDDLNTLLKMAGFNEIEVSNFEFGYNTFVRAKK